MSEKDCDICAPAICVGEHEIKDIYPIGQLFGVEYGVCFREDGNKTPENSDKLFLFRSEGSTDWYRGDIDQTVRLIHDKIRFMPNPKNLSDEEDE